MELLETMVNEVNTRAHLQPLLKGKTLAVKFDIKDKDPVFLIIENEYLQLNSTSEREVDAYVAGDAAAVESLLNGNVRLREAINHDILHFEGTFRISLFLESLFSLALMEKEILQANQKEIL